MSPHVTKLSGTNTMTTSTANHSLVATIFSVLGVLVVSAFVAMGVFYVYQKRLVFRKSFDISMHFENPGSGIDTAQVKMCPKPQLTSINQYNEVYMNAQVWICGLLDMEKK